MNDRVTDLIFIGLALKEVEQAIFADVLFTVEVHDQSGIQVTIVPELVIEVFLYKMKIPEYGGIGYKCYKGAIIFCAFCFLIFFKQYTLFKFC